MALESNSNVETQTQNSTSTSPQPLLTTTTMILSNIPSIHSDAPPAYTPFSSTASLVQNDQQPIQYRRFIALEVKALRILAIGSVILGSVSIFVAILAVVFGTLLYCTGTGLWSGFFCTLNGSFCLFRLLRRNTPNIMKCLCAFSCLTIMACVMSIAFSIFGTATTFDICCNKNVFSVSEKYICNYTASQLANTLLTCIGFIQTVFTILTTALYAKYSSSCCNDDYSQDFMAGHQHENNHYRIL